MRVMDEVDVLDTAMLAEGADREPDPGSVEHLEWIDRHIQTRDTRRKRDEAFIQKRLDALRKRRERGAGEEDSQEQPGEKAS